jgi:transposase InsO family protein
MKSRFTKVGVGRLCRLFGKTRQSFYEKTWHYEGKLEDEFVVVEMVSEIRREMPKIGTNKLYQMLKGVFQNQNIKIGRDSLYRILQEHKMIIKPKKRYIKTTDSKHWMKKYPNLIRGFIPIESEQLWVADITYIQVQDDFNFLSLITDAYSKQIMGYCLYPTLESKGCIIALKMAFESRKKNSTLVHHSDRGTQYCCAEYVEMLQTNDIKISMTEKGDPYENAIAERINGILKTEFELHKRFINRKQALETVKSSIEIYNEKRPHMSCDYLTPVEAHTKTGQLPKRWKSRSSKFGYSLEKGFYRHVKDSMYTENDNAEQSSGIMPSYQDIPSEVAPQQSPSPLLLIKSKLINS